MTWILLKKRTVFVQITHTHTYSTYNELECCRLQHTNARLDMVISFKYKPTLLFHTEFLSLQRMREDIPVDGHPHILEAQ